MKTVFKLVTALAAIAGAIYVISTYGDQIVAWAKKIREKFPAIEFTLSSEGEPVEEETEAPAEEAPAEEAPAEEAPAEEAVTESDFQA